MEIKNAVIKSTKLGFEDHGILTCYIELSYGGSSQGFGGYGFGSTIHKRITMSGFGTSFLAMLLVVAGVDTYENLKGSPVRVEAQFDKVIQIGHYLDDIWLDPEELARKFP